MKRCQLPTTTALVHAAVGPGAEIAAGSRGAARAEPAAVGLPLARCCYTTPDTATQQEFGACSASRPPAGEGGTRMAVPTGEEMR